MTAIYSIINKLTGQQYIGSAINFYTRKRKHLEDLRKNKHHSYKLQNDWNKYNDETIFDFIIIEKVDLKENLIKREQWWLDNVNPFYNICKVANSSLGVKRTLEFREKMSQRQLGVKHPEWRNEIKRKSQSGEKHWTKKRKFSDESRQKMSDSHKKLYKSGYKHPLCGVSRPDIIQKMACINKKAVLQYDLDGNLIQEWDCANTAAKKLGFRQPNISSCCLGKRKTYKTFIWKFKNIV